MGQTLLDELSLLPRLLLCELYLLEQGIQVHFCLLVELVGSEGLVFVEGWLVKAGVSRRKVRLGPNTALPSGLCAEPGLGSALGSASMGLGKEPQTMEGSDHGRWDTAAEEEVTVWDVWPAESKGARVNLRQRETWMTGWGNAGGGNEHADKQHSRSTRKNIFG